VTTPQTPRLASPPQPEQMALTPPPLHRQLVQSYALAETLYREAREWDRTARDAKAAVDQSYDRDVWLAYVQACGEANARRDRAAVLRAAVDRYAAAHHIDIDVVAREADAQLAASLGDRPATHTEPAVVDVPTGGLL
jgi:hypothetical protein